MPGPPAYGHRVDAEQRVWARLPTGTADAVAALPGSDLTTVLLGVARERAARVRPADVMRRWRADRLVRPAAADPRRVSRVEARLWELLPPEFDGVELSPVVPLGTCTAVTPAGQDRIVSGMRPVEVLSDPTNALAVEAAARRGRGPVHLAACHRVLRAQPFAPGMSQHFRLFALVSSGRDDNLLKIHLDYWRRVLDDLLPQGRLEIQGPRGYYVGPALKIFAGDVELGDGGFTTWTAQLRGDAKQRCLTSCLATERLTSLIEPGLGH